jgi:hypothetical protein
MILIEKFCEKIVDEKESEEKCAKYCYPKVNQRIDTQP